MTDAPRQDLSNPDGYPCDAPGCTLPGPATWTLWLDTPLGSTAVHVHEDRACANAAREARGGGKFVPERLSALEREQRAAHGGTATGGLYTVDWGRVIEANDRAYWSALYDRIRATQARIAARSRR